MRLLEKVFAGGILIALILKFNLISGGDIFLLWSILLVTILYYPFGFLFFNQIRLRDIFKKAAYKDTNMFKIVVAFIAGLGLAIICVGSLFKLLHFRGANEMLIVGLSTILAVSLLILASIIRKDKVYSTYILVRVWMIGGVGVVLLLFSELDLIKIQYRNHPAYIKAYAEYLRHPESEDAVRKKDMEGYKIILSEEEFKRYEEESEGAKSEDIE
jgi:hypothetical protein